ncbi:Serine/threonine-protein kinase SMG1 [Trinorchestia longiramus]|nr:Serine/threonine-protein kinase SMG1 [Trinorchestia longiramus]
MGGDKSRGRGGSKRPSRGAASDRSERRPRLSKYSDDKDQNREESMHTQKPRGSSRGSQRGTFSRRGFSKSKGHKRLEDEDEETTISRQLRKLQREEKPDLFNTQMAVLNDLLVLPDNLHYIQRCAHFLLDSLYDLLSSAPNSACKVQAVHVMAFINHLLLPDDYRFVKLAVDGLRDSQDAPASSAVKVLLLMAIREAITLDKSKRSSLLWGHDTVECVCSVLEGTEELPLMVAAVEVLRLLYEVRPQQLSDVFEDVVDILIGWHIDTEQPHAVREYVRETLTSFTQLWREHTTLVSTLLSQFLDDMKEYLQELEASLVEDYSPGPDAEKPDVCAEKVQLFLSVFECVLACCTAGEDANQTGLVAGFLLGCLDSVLAAAHTLLRCGYCCHGTSLFATLNHLVLHCLQLEVSVFRLEPQLLQLLQLQRGRLVTASHASQLAYLDLLIKVLSSESRDLGSPLVAEMFCQESPLRQLRLSREDTVWRAALKVHHSASALKNVPLLQDVYQYILSDLTECHAVLTGGRPSLTQDTTAAQLQEEESMRYSDAQAAAVFTFLITALVQLSKVRNSMICMWALDPSLLQLLALRLTASDPILASQHPKAHLTLVRTLHTHCKAHHNFVGSSSLLGARTASDSFPSFKSNYSAPSFTSFVPASATSSIASFVPSQSFQHGAQPFVFSSVPSFSSDALSSNLSNFSTFTSGFHSNAPVSEYSSNTELTEGGSRASSSPPAVMSTTSPAPTPAFGVSSTSQNLAIIVRTLDELLGLGARCSPEVLELCVQWCADICSDTAHSSCNTAATSAAVQPLLLALVRLISTGSRLSSKLIISAAHAMTSIVRLLVLPEAAACLDDVAQLCSAMLCHQSNEIAAAYLTVYTALPLAVVVTHHDRHCSGRTVLRKKSDGKFRSIFESIELVQKHYQLSVNCWNELSSVNFHQLARFLLDTSENSCSGKGDWLELIGMMAQQIQSKASSPDLGGRHKNATRNKALQSLVKIDNAGDAMLDSRHYLGQQIARTDELIFQADPDNYSNLRGSLAEVDNKLGNFTAVENGSYEHKHASGKTRDSPALAPEPESIESSHTKESSSQLETLVTDDKPDENLFAKEFSNEPDKSKGSSVATNDRLNKKLPPKVSPKTSFNADDVVNTEILGELCHSNKRLLWQWLMWLVAQHCVANKLKTSLGKPQDLFSSIEVAIRNRKRQGKVSGFLLPSYFHSDLSSLNTKPRLAVEEVTKSGADPANGCTEVRAVEADRSCNLYDRDEFPQVMMLLEFVSCLEKSLMLARDGCVSYTQPVSKAVRAFFSSNRDTCSEGMASFRFPTAIVSLNVGMPHEALRHALTLLKSLVSEALLS